MEIVQTGIQLQNDFTSVVIGSINSIEEVGERLNQAAITAQELSQGMGRQTSANLPSLPTWENQSNMQAFNDTGIHRFMNEMNSLSEISDEVLQSQRQIGVQALGMRILPPNASWDLDVTSRRITELSQQLGDLQPQDINVIGDSDDQTIESGGLSGGNEGHHPLNNRSGLAGAIKGKIAEYATIDTAKSIMSASDEFVQTSLQLDLMNDGLQSTGDLLNMAYAVAQDARGEFGAMTGVIAQLGNNAKGAFSSSAEIVQFAGLVQKQMTIAGASTSEASNAMLQLSQALGSGVLSGDELNSIFENAPNLIQNIADYLNVPAEKVFEMADQGKVSADVVKQAIFAATDEINEKFNSVPVTWEQIWTSMQNAAKMAFQPIFQEVNEIANSEQFQEFTNIVMNAMAMVAGILLQVFGLIGTVAQFAAEHWNILGPIVYGVVGALIAYVACLGVWNVIQAISTGLKIAATVAEYAYAAVMRKAVSATTAETAAQLGLNTALLSCPLTWIIVLILSLIAVIIALANYFSGAGHIALTVFGAICGGVNVVIQFFKNLGISFANISLGIAAAVAALGENIMTAFHNAICSVQSWWYGLLSTVLTVVAGICEALNKLPFVEFDYSGITNAADDYAAKSEAAADNKRDYVSIGDAFLDAAQTYDAFKGDWISDSYREGAKWGDGVSDKVTKAVKGIKNNIPDLDQGNSPKNVANSGNKAAEIAKNTGDTAKSAERATQSLDITGENLKYIKDMAEREYINRFTTAKINIKQTNHNKVKNGMDLDGINEYLRSDLEQRIAATAEGVH